MPSESPPIVVIVSGPNGAGKSTAAPRLLAGALSVSEFVNADTVARGLSAFSPEGVAVASGRIVLRRIRELAGGRASFAFETTLASRLFAPWIAGLRSEGYRFCLLYLWLPSADLAVRRVERRVEAGGHFVPEVVVRRRYEAGRMNFFDLYQPIADTWRVYDNSAMPAPRLIASGERAEVLRVTDPRSWGRFLGGRDHGGE